MRSNIDIGAGGSSLKREAKKKKQEKKTKYGCTCTIGYCVDCWCATNKRPCGRYCHGRGSGGHQPNCMRTVLPPAADDKSLYARIHAKFEKEYDRDHKLTNSTPTTFGAVFSILASACPAELNRLPRMFQDPLSLAALETFPGEEGEGEEEDCRHPRPHASQKRDEKVAKKRLRPTKTPKEAKNRKRTRVFRQPQPPDAVDRSSAGGMMSGGGGGGGSDSGLPPSVSPPPPPPPPPPPSASSSSSSSSSSSPPSSSSSSSGGGGGGGGGGDGLGANRISTADEKKAEAWARGKALYTLLNNVNGGSFSSTSSSSSSSSAPPPPPPLTAVSSATEMKTAWRRAARFIHPDKLKDDDPDGGFKHAQWNILLSMMDKNAQTPSPPTTVWQGYGSAASSSAAAFASAAAAFVPPRRSGFVFTAGMCIYCIVGGLACPLHHPSQPLHRAAAAAAAAAASQRFKR